MKLGTRELLLFLFFVTTIFDFKRAEGSEGNAVVLLGIANMMIGFALIYKIRFIPKPTFHFALPFLIFLIVGIGSGILRGQSVYSVIASAVPLIIFINALLVTATIAPTSNKLSGLLDVVIVFSLIAAIWKVLFALGYYGLNLQTARFQILSGATPLLFAYGATSFLFKARKYMLLAVVASLGVVAISVTRSYLVVFACSALALVWAIPKHELGKVVSRIASSTLVFIALIAAVIVALPDVTLRWVTRLTSSSSMGFDLTGATRLAEAAYQVQQLKSDTSGLLFGFGMNAETHFFGPNVQLIQSVLGNKGIDFSGHGYGHIFYVGLFYVGGVFAATFVFAGFFAILRNALRKLKSTTDALSAEDKFAYAFGLTSMAGYLAFGFLGGTWGDRSTSFFFGLTCGLAIRRTN